MNRLPLLLASWVNWKDRSHLLSALHWGLPLPFGAASNLSWFVKICASLFCPTSAIPLLLTYLLRAPVSLQSCYPLEQKPSLCCFCHQEGDFCITENLIASCVVYAVLNHNAPNLLLHQEQQGEQRGAVPHSLCPSGWCPPGCMGCEQPLSLCAFHCWDQGQQQFGQNEVCNLTAESAPFLWLGKAHFQCRAADVRALQVVWGRGLVLSVWHLWFFMCIRWKLRLVAVKRGGPAKRRTVIFFFAILYLFFFCIQDGGGKGRLRGFYSAEE